MGERHMLPRHTNATVVIRVPPNLYNPHSHFKAFSIISKGVIIIKVLQGS